MAGKEEPVRFDQQGIDVVRIDQGDEGIVLHVHDDEKQENVPVPEQGKPGPVQVSAGVTEGHDRNDEAQVQRKQPLDLVRISE